MQVVVGIIINKEQQVLITKRSNQGSHPGKWEFPGGKVEKNESASSALIREIKEEVGLNVINYTFLTKSSHIYDDKLISLMIYKVTEFSGTAAPLESQQDMLWVNINELNNFKFPKANKEIIDFFKLNLAVFSS